MDSNEQQRLRWQGEQDRQRNLPPPNSMPDGQRVHYDKGHQNKS